MIVVENSIEVSKRFFENKAIGPSNHTLGIYLEQFKSGSWRNHAPIFIAALFGLMKI